jgi:hypothetical protein
MLQELNTPQPSNWLLNNLITEGRVLHTRNLCDVFCGSGYKDDIKLTDLFDDYQTATHKYQHLAELVTDLKDKYETSEQGSNVRSIFNKRLAHPTKERGTGFDYRPYLQRVWPVLHEIINELWMLRGQPL